MKNLNPRTDSKGRPYSYSRFSIGLALYFVASILVPNMVLAYTEDYSVWSTEALILLPLGFYLMWSVALRRSGIMIWLGFPFVFFAALGNLKFLSHSKCHFLSFLWKCRKSLISSSSEFRSPFLTISVASLTAGLVAVPFLDFRGLGTGSSSHMA